jgi:hypothetical protein
MRAPIVRTELMINFNIHALDQMDESSWVEPHLAMEDAAEDETLLAAMRATADNLPISNDAGGVDWQSGNGAVAAVPAAAAAGAPAGGGLGASDRQTDRLTDQLTDRPTDRPTN